MDSFRNKLVPSKINRLDLDTQEDFCNNTQCEIDELLDCGECILSERFCKKDLFEEWKRTLKDKEDEQS